jgi:hypothetical protein
VVLSKLRYSFLVKCCRSGSARILYFLPGPEREVMDPDRELDLELNKNYLNRWQCDNYDIKIH